DAAAQMQAWRPDALDAPAATWGEVLDLARQGRVLLPLRPPHCLMTFYTLAGNLGRPCGTDPSHDLIAIETGSEVFERMREIAALLVSACFDMDPIAVS
ncbi:carbohydrate ABC transporter substrate-binding protein, partial [bacterium M00.F.Ca.ET.163.01.1.1]